MPRAETPDRYSNQYGADRYGDSKSASRGTYGDNHEQDNARKESEEKTMRVSAYLGEKSRVRSISMYDARPLAEKAEVKKTPERSDNRISEEKRKQIEQGTHCYFPSKVVKSV